MPTMHATDTINLIREFLKDRLDLAPENVQPESNLVDLGIDSLMMLELMFAVEDHFDIKLDQNMSPAKTIGELVDRLEDIIRTQKSSAEVTGS